MFTCNDLICCCFIFKARFHHKAVKEIWERQSIRKEKKNVKSVYFFFLLFFIWRRHKIIFDNHSSGVGWGRFKLNNSTIRVKLDLLKPEVENVKPLMSVSEVCQHSRSLIVGHTPNADVSSNMTYIMITSPLPHHHPIVWQSLSS